VTHHLLDYPSKIRNSGNRVTPQRKIILDAICAAGRSITVEEIIARVQKKSPSLNQATIYRNLIFLQDMHLLDAAGRGRKRAYEIASLSPHHHLICTLCGRELEIDGAQVDRLRETIRKELGFQIDRSHMSFQGMCRACIRKQRKK